MPSTKETGPAIERKAEQVFYFETKVSERDLREIITLLAKQRGKDLTPGVDYAVSVKPSHVKIEGEK